MPHAEIMFDQPKPEGETKLNAIPGILYGRYLSPSDSALLIVSEKEIVLKTIWDVNFSLTELDSVEKLNLKDTVYHDEGGSMSVRIKNDSVYQRSISFDTLNYSSGHYVLKEVKGYYFMNKSVGRRWVTRTLRIIDNEIFLSSIRSKEEVDTLGNQGSAQSDPILSTTDEEDIIKKGRVIEETKFIKIITGQ